MLEPKTKKEDKGSIVVIICVAVLGMVLMCQGVYRYGKKKYWIPHQKRKTSVELAKMKEVKNHKVILSRLKTIAHAENKSTEVQTFMGKGVLLASRADGTDVISLTNWKLAGGNYPILFSGHSH